MKDITPIKLFTLTSRTFRERRPSVGVYSGLCFIFLFCLFTTRGIQPTHWSFQRELGALSLMCLTSSVLMRTEEFMFYLFCHVFRYLLYYSTNEEGRRRGRRYKMLFCVGTFDGTFERTGSEVSQLAVSSLQSTFNRSPAVELAY